MTLRCILAALEIWSTWEFLPSVATISASKVTIRVLKFPYPQSEIHMEMSLARHTRFSYGLTN